MIFGEPVINQWKKITRNGNGTYTVVSASGFIVTGTLGELLENDLVKAKEIDEFFGKLLRRNRPDGEQYSEVINEIILEKL
jgi:hypothetical protein